MGAQVWQWFAWKDDPCGETRRDQSVEAVEGAGVRQLESALADANIDLALERAYTRMACEQAGIGDVKGFWG